MSVEPVRALVFDAYGTLLDVNAATTPEIAVLAHRAAPLAALWRQKQIEYTWLRALMGRYEDFEAVTADALDAALDAMRVTDPGLRERLLEAYLRLQPYAEAAEVLADLKARGLPRIVLSNGSPRMLAAAFTSAGLDALLDDVLSVDPIRTFKPSPEVYLLATRRLGLPARAVGFVSSNAWDAHGAASFGFEAAWVNRSGAARERLPGALMAELQDLRALPAAFGLDG
jgi:2-haloacid dehalogenase